MSHQFFGAINEESGDFNGDPAAGLLGLAFSTIAQVRHNHLCQMISDSVGSVLKFGIKTSKPTMFEKLITAGIISLKLFAFSLLRGSVSGSELSVGKVDTSKFSPPIT